MNNINFYKHEKLQKYIPKISDEQVKYSGMKLFRHILICGSTGAGKTLALLNYIAHSSKPRDGTYKKIILVYKSDEPLYRFLKDELKDDLITFKSVSEMMTVDKFKDGSKENTAKKIKENGSKAADRFC